MNIEKLRRLRAYVEEHPVEFTVAGETEEDEQTFITYYNLVHSLMPYLLEAADLIDPLSDYAADATLEGDPLPQSVKRAYAVGLVLRGE